MRNRPKGCGLYVHVPFCRTRCIYCDFYSTTGIALVGAWIEALRQEMLLYEADFGRFDSLYIGGGTPTVLGDGMVARLMEALHARFRFAPDCEVTIEANPDDVDQARLEAMKGLGINRVSFGVQSFDDRDLAFLGRRHTAGGARKALEAAIGAGFSNFGIDLMYGLPAQTCERWLTTLEGALFFRPTHLSCYQLTVEGRTPLSHMIGRNEASLPGEEEGRAFFLLTSRFLEDRGFVHYEVSNFAASRRFFCRHNGKYWSHVPYLGLGPAAHSFDGLQRWWNHRSLKRYVEALARGRKPVAGSELLSEEQLELERLSLGLRTRRGIRLPDLPETALPLVHELRKARLVRVRGNRLSLSRRGYLVADSLPVLLSRPSSPRTRALSMP
jgi:oxygen-independent coproporphyrinogen-3 oxidase